MSQTGVRINVEDWKRILALFNTSLIQNDRYEVHAGGVQQGSARSAREMANIFG